MNEGSTIQTDKAGGDAAVAQKLRHEYHLLRGLTGKLQEMAQRTPADDGALSTLRKTLEHVRAHLHRQFGLEEMNGFLNVVMERRPSLEHEVKHLKDEHGRLLEMVDWIYAEAGNLRVNDPAWGDMALRLNHFLSELSHHEQTENMLVANIFGIDVGAGD